MSLQLSNVIIALSNHL